MARVAVDLIGEGLPPEDLLDELATALDLDPRLALTVVAPTASVESALVASGVLSGGRCQVVNAARGVAAGPEALSEVRARRDSGVRVAARLVRDGQADAMVSVAPLEAVLAAARFTLGLVPGATRTAAAVVLGSVSSPVVLCDAGGSVDVTADELAQFALSGTRYATACHGVVRPRVGLLSARPALQDQLRRSAGDLLSSLGLHFVGPVTADRLRTGAGVDVVVTDGFTGDVVLAALGQRAASTWVGSDPASPPAVGSELQGGMIVLGVDGTAVQVGRPCAAGPGRAGDLSAAVGAAAGAVRAGLAGSVRDAMATLVERRRELAGLSR
ncbi:glycerol-3-phosphate acyltransferase PlsX [Parafrankia irregularis]|uniref:phosphate acyltransferase n=1 Tax=Parafrankia irregularis TaxID=795642 RepID=A0A0S4QLI9_9ACTN|nr:MULTISPECIES: phosphate acyltransferase [Parafrankia]MBE3205412.1 phosphate starvation-inducible protein PhoH [Parafrankia sp. CH37]CUU55692.1 glycerol-3-phosphate acyltransferase PlsX [Parafrankia irregularis]